MNINYSKFVVGDDYQILESSKYGNLLVMRPGKLENNKKVVTQMGSKCRSYMFNEVLNICLNEKHYARILNNDAYQRLINGTSCVYIQSCYIEFKINEPKPYMTFGLYGENGYLIVEIQRSMPNKYEIQSLIFSSLIVMMIENFQSLPTEEIYFFDMIEFAQRLVIPLDSKESQETFVDLYTCYSSLIDNYQINSICINRKNEHIETHYSHLKTGNNMFVKVGTKYLTALLELFNI